MNYKEFYTATTKGIDFRTIDKATMEFAYLVFHKVFGEEPLKALQSSIALN